MYGQTEASPRMSYLQSKHGLKKIGSIGKEIPGGKIFLVDENNKKIKKSNQVGELIYKGDNVSMGYAYSYKDLFKLKNSMMLIYTGVSRDSSEQIKKINKELDNVNSTYIKYLHYQKKNVFEQIKYFKNDNFIKLTKTINKAWTLKNDQINKKNKKLINIIKKNKK